MRNLAWRFRLRFLPVTAVFSFSWWCAFNALTLLIGSQDCLKARAGLHSCSEVYTSANMCEWPCTWKWIYSEHNYCHFAQLCYACEFGLNESDWMLVCWWWWFDWSFAQLTAPGPVVTTTNHHHHPLPEYQLPANPGSPGKWPLKRREKVAHFSQLLFSQNIFP